MRLEKIAVLMMLATTASAGVGSRAGRAADGMAAWNVDAGTDSLSEETGQFRIYSRAGDDGSRQYKVTAPDGFSRTYTGVKDVRGVGRYLVVDADGTIRYYDLLRRAQVFLAGNGLKESEDFLEVAALRRGALCSTAIPSGGFVMMRDFLVLRDALRYYLNGTAQQAETAVSRIQAKANGGDYAILHADARDVTVDARDVIYYVWPEFGHVEGGTFRPEGQEKR